MQTIVQSPSLHPQPAPAPMPWQLSVALSPGGEAHAEGCPQMGATTLAPMVCTLLGVYGGNGSSETRTLDLELKVPTPAAAPKINGVLIRAGGNGQRRLLRAASCATLGASCSEAAQEPGSAPTCCCHDALLLLPSHFQRPVHYRFCSPVLCLLREALPQDRQGRCARGDNSPPANSSGTVTL